MRMNVDNGMKVVSESWKVPDELNFEIFLIIVLNRFMKEYIYFLTLYKGKVRVESSRCG